MTRREWRQDPLEGSTPYPRPEGLQPINPMRLDQHCSDPQEIHESPMIGNPSAMNPRKWNNDGKFGRMIAGTIEPGRAPYAYLARVHHALRSRMMEPPINPDPPKDSAFNQFYKSNQAILDRLLMLIITAVLAGVFHVKLNDIEGKQDTIEHKADVAAVNSVETKAVTTETRAAVTGEAKDVAAAEAAKAEVQEVKNAAK
jgi:hypothetical protein